MENNDEIIRQIVGRVDEEFKEEIRKSLEELKNLNLDPPRRFIIKRKIPCPKCGEPMTWRKGGSWECLNEACKVISANFDGERITRLKVAATV